MDKMRNDMHNDLRLLFWILIAYFTQDYTESVLT